MENGHCGEPPMEDYVSNNRRNAPGRRVPLGAWIAIGFLLILMVVMLPMGLRNVGPTERAVVFHTDGSLTIMEPGKFQWVWPVFNDVTKYSIRDQTYTKEAIGISLDLQETTTEVTIRYHLEEDEVSTVHRTLGHDYERKVVKPSVQDCVKSSVAYYNVEELTGPVREQVKQDIIRCVTLDLNSANLIVSEISITDFDFSEEFNAAIERKAIAQQAALEERNRLDQIIYQANQTIVAAEAQSRAAELLAQTGNSEVYLFLEWLKRWDGHLPQFLGGDNTGILLQPPME